MYYLRNLNTLNETSDFQKFTDKFYYLRNLSTLRKPWTFYKSQTKYIALYCFSEHHRM